MTDPTTIRLGIAKFFDDNHWNVPIEAFRQTPTRWEVARTRYTERPEEIDAPTGHHWTGPWEPFGVTEIGLFWRRPCSNLGVPRA